MSGAAVAVMVAKARRRIVDHFEQASAFSPVTAVPFEPRDRRIDRRLFRRMQAHGAIVETTPGYYYLDRDGLARFRASMRKRVLGILAIAGGAVAAALALG